MHAAGTVMGGPEVGTPRGDRWDVHRNVRVCSGLVRGESLSSSKSDPKITSIYRPLLHQFNKKINFFMW